LRDTTRLRRTSHRTPNEIIIIINEKYLLTTQMMFADDSVIHTYTTTNNIYIITRELRKYRHIFSTYTHFDFPFSFHIVVLRMYIICTLYTEVIMYVCRRLCLSLKWWTEFNCYMAFGRVFWLSGFSRVVGTHLPCTTHPETVVGAGLYYYYNSPWYIIMIRRFSGV